MRRSDPPSELMMPAAPDIEELVLGALLADPEAREPILQIANEDWFSLRQNCLIFRAACRCYALTGELDRALVVRQLQEDGQLEVVGGISRLCNLDNALPRLYGLDGYLEILRQKYILRQAAEWAQRTVAACCAPGASMDTVRHAEEVVRTIAAETSPKRGGLMSVGDWLESESTGIKALFDADKSEVVAQWPFGLDRILHGLRAGQLIIIGARPGAGKSAMAAHLAIEAARGGAPVAMFSMEMNRADVFRRMIANISGISLNKVRNSTDGPEDIRRTTMAALTAIDSAPIYIDDSARANTASILHEVKRHAAAGRPKIRCIIVDYLQLMKAPGRASTRAEEVSDLTRSLKLGAMQLGVPIVVLAQLNRESVREESSPELHHLKDSGSTEQDADVVIFLHVTGKARREAIQSNLPTEVDLIVAKHRNGPIGNRRVLFRGDIMRLDPFD